MSAHQLSRIVHCKKDKFDVYIGRPSKWGNPFSHKSDTLAQHKARNRKEAIAAYKNWLLNGEGKHLLQDLHELKGKTLGCWCKPEACHGDVLIELINSGNV